MRTRMWSMLWKRATLALVATVVALSWSQTGRAQQVCTIERGQDPLDILNSGVRHNVWITLDASGSMSDVTADGRTRIQVAKDAINQLMDELVDAAGAPLVNWAFSYYAVNTVALPFCGTEDLDGDGYPDEPSSCVGLKDGAFVAPSTCGGDSRQQVRQTLDQVTAGGFTPIGVGFTDLAHYITGNHKDNTIDYVGGLLDGQKNYIIHVTDGQDTCECNQFGYDIPTLDQNGDGVFDVPVRGSEASPDVTGFSDQAADRRAYNAGLKGFVALEKIDPALDGSEGNVFVLGLDLDDTEKERMNTIAWMASGGHKGRDRALLNPAFFAESDELVDVFRNILAKIGVPQSVVTLGSPVVGTVRELIPSHTNTFTTSGDHVGDVVTPDADDIDLARKTRANHQNNVLFTTSVEVPGFKGHFKAINIFEVTDAANPRTARDPDFTEVWDAGDLLQQTSPDARNILFNKRGQTALLPFDDVNVTAADLGVSAGFLDFMDGTGALTDDDARDMVLGVVRGYRLSVHPTTGKLYDTNNDINFSEFEADGVTPTWKLWDSTASPAIVQNPPRSPDFDPPQNHADKYGVGGTKVGDGFFWDHFNRETMVYLPTNGGVMHAFRAETGEELFAYIPDDVLGLDPAETPGSRDTLATFVELVVAENNGIINHRFTLSGPPIVDDAFLRSDFGGDDQWHTILAFGRGRGGRFVSGLDITNPAAPALRFNVGNREGISEGLFDGLGETWSPPVMGNVQTQTGTSGPDRVDQWLAFLGAGYGCDNANDEGQYLYALRVEDGSIHFRGQISSDNKAPIRHNVVVTMPTLFNPHEEDVSDSKDFVTRVYFGDVQGNIWKLVTTDIDPINWELNVFAELGTDQPITAAVTTLNDVNSQRVFVLAGTGGDLRVDSSTTDFKFAAFIDTDAEGVATTQYPLGTAPFFERALNPDERVFVPPVTIGTIGDATPPVVFFAASRPEFNTTTCVSEFFSSLFALGVLSGQAEVDLDGGGGDDDNIDLGEGKVTGLYARDGNLYVSESGGLGSSGELTVFGDGDFDDELPTAGGSFSVQVLVDGFRLSPF